MSIARICLLVRQNCHLCIDAVEVLDRVTEKTGVVWYSYDVDKDPSLAEEFGDRIPIVFLDGKEHSHWRVDEKQLLADLVS